MHNRFTCCKFSQSVSDVSVSYYGRWAMCINTVSLFLSVLRHIVQLRLFQVHFSQWWLVSIFFSIDFFCVLLTYILLILLLWCLFFQKSAICWLSGWISQFWNVTRNTHVLLYKTCYRVFWVFSFSCHVHLWLWLISVTSYFKLFRSASSMR